MSQPALAGLSSWLRALDKSVTRGPAEAGSPDSAGMFRPAASWNTLPFSASRYIGAVFPP